MAGQRRRFAAGWLACALAAFCLVLLLCPPAPAQAPDDPSTHLQVDVPLVLIPVHVTTLLGAAVTGLQRQNFRLFEDGAEQKITHFLHEEGPVSIGLVLDASASMRNKMRKSWEAAAEFRKTSDPADEVFLIAFNERPALAVPFTRDWELVHRRLLRTRALGRTSLLDAVHFALSEMQDAKYLRKAILILSDGGDNHSRYTEAEIKRAVREADVQIYGLGIFNPEDTPPRTTEERNGPLLLEDLAAATGGRHFPVNTLADLPAACAHIGRDLRDQYVLGYSPSRPAPTGRYRRVTVTLTATDTLPPLKVYHRPGYYDSPR